MLPLTHAAVVAVMVLMVLPSMGCIQDLNHRGYCDLQSHILFSTTVLRKLRASVPSEYVHTMLQAPDYVVPVAELPAFLSQTGDSAFQQALEGRIRETGDAQQGEGAEQPNMPGLRACTVMFYDEAAHFDRPLSSCMGFVACWYLVGPDEKVLGAGACHPGTLLRKAGAKWKRQSGP